MSVLDTSIEYLKGVGPARAELLQSERNIRTFRDLLHDYPFRYIDRRTFQDISSLEANGQAAQIKGTLVRLATTGYGKSKRLIGYFKDDTGVIELVWFRSVKWLKKSLKPGSKYVVYGKVNDFKGKKSIPHPEMDLIKEGKTLSKTFEPVYNSTELLRKKGLTNKRRRTLIKNLFKKIDVHELNETLPEYLIKKAQLCSRGKALKWVHVPPDRPKLKAARYRLKFEELFWSQLLIGYKMQKRKQQIKGNIFETIGSYFHEFYEQVLPFELTDAQKRVVREIRRDFKTGHQMNRLLQGDVGSGKTIVAFLSMLIAIDNGFQSAIMAPTEILAQQHYRSISGLAEELDLEVRLLTGSVTGSEREDILRRLEDGSIEILIGTHALIEEHVKFDKLGLAVTDEQHRFGVAQRARLWAKGRSHPPHILVMTATPIPRTMAMTTYGDLDVSVIDELPPGRKPVKTYHIRDHKRPKLIEFMRKQIEQGQQIYVVYPLIEDSSKMDLQSLMNGYERMINDFPPPDYHISMVHGQMKPEAKDQEMQRFNEHKTDIMMATTVIEVGVDVPNATVMVVENAERFGLSQLHQLRGRVGRSGDQSYCILVSGGKLGETAAARLNIMCQTSDGFRIAEKDLQLRGPGEMEGTRQSGAREFNIADLSTDEPILKRARKFVLNILQDDPELQKDRNKQLNQYMQTTGKEKVSWSRIG